MGGWGVSYPNFFWIFIFFFIFTRPLTTLFEKKLNFNVDTFDNCLSDVHCPITLSLHAVNTNHIPNNVQPHDNEVVAGC